MGARPERAARARENRSRIEAGAIHERFSPRFSFVYQRWCVTRTIPVGRAVSSSGAFQAKQPRACVAQAVFRPRFVRVPSVVQYANDFRARFRSCIEGGALRERFPDPSEGAGPGDGPLLGHETGKEMGRRGNAPPVHWLGPTTPWLRAASALPWGTDQRTCGSFRRWKPRQCRRTPA